LLKPFEIALKILNNKAIEPELPSDPPMMIPKIDYVTHEMGAEQMKDFYPFEQIN
jgi:hypothetical protein